MSWRTFEWDKASWSGPGWVDFTPWQMLGDEAMVAWDRDVAPHLVNVSWFELIYAGPPKPRSLSKAEGNVNAHVSFHGMEMCQGVNHQAVWYAEVKVWRTTFDGWRPWYLNG